MFKRFRRWVKARVFQTISDAVLDDPDMDDGMLDGGSSGEQIADKAFDSDGIIETMNHVAQPPSQLDESEKIPVSRWNFIGKIEALNGYVLKL